MPQEYDSRPVKKKKAYKPVTVKVTKSAHQANIPVQQAVTKINKVARTQVVRTTKSRKNADVVVKALRSPTRKQEGTTGTTSRIPKSRAQIERGRTVVKISPKAASVNREYAATQKSSPKPGPKRRRVSARTRTTVHELGHSLGLPDRYWNKRTTKSVMDTGSTLTGYDVKKIKKTTGARNTIPAIEMAKRGNYSGIKRLTKAAASGAGNPKTHPKVSARITKLEKFTYSNPRSTPAKKKALQLDKKYFVPRKQTKKAIKARRDR